MSHYNYYYDLTITAFIVNNNRVLLVNHPSYGKWIPIGGHVDPDEDPETALFREIEEETGIKKVAVLSDKPRVECEGTKFLLTPNYMDVHEANPPHKHISLTYFLTTDDDEFSISSEHTDMKWFTSDDLQNPKYNLSSAVLFYASEAINSVRLD